MILECRLNYNNKMYGKGNAYIAKIIGKDLKFKFKRQFINKDIEYSNSSSTTWYKYSWDIKETGIYEWNENNGFKRERMYFKYDFELNSIEFIQLEDIDIIEE